MIERAYSHRKGLIQAAFHATGMIADAAPNHGGDQGQFRTPEIGVLAVHAAGHVH